MPIGSVSICTYHLHFATYYFCPGKIALLNIVVSLTCTAYLCGTLPTLYESENISKF